MLSIPSVKPVEHFVTLFDSNFLSIGMCLHASLMAHGQPFHLWILCMDELVEEQLRRLDLSYVSLIPLREAESDALLEVKKDRTRGEYCWTLTPFSPQFVFDRDQTVKRVTYLDTDIFFFDSPQILLEEFEKSGKHVLITEHAYAPEYNHSITAGRFCVQFMTFCRTNESNEVMRWWQDRCLEWCFARYEDGKFGDQRYLDDWPERFPNAVHVLHQKEKTFAPWNVDFFLEAGCSPVFFHFQGLRIFSPKKVQLYAGYHVNKGHRFYLEYMAVLRKVILLANNKGIPLKVAPVSKERFHTLRTIIRTLIGITKYARL
jgi:hypothetical protein